MVDVSLEGEVAIPIGATFVGSSSSADDNAATASNEKNVDDTNAYNENNALDSKGNARSVAISDGVNQSAEQDIEAFCIDVDVPLTEPDMSNQIEALPVGATGTDASTVSSTPNETGRRRSRRKSSDDKKPREKVKRGDTRKCVKKKTAIGEDLGDGLARTLASIAPEHDSDRKDISRPTSRGSMASSFNGMGDDDFMTKYKRLKLILKEKEIEIKKLEEDADAKEELLKKQGDTNHGRDRRWQRIWIWKNITASAEEKALSVPDPAIIAQKMRRRRLMALIFIGIVLVVMPIVAVTELRPMIVA
eukprot:GEMP01067545.1.p1 GENE.GEMP01067545.1~~GEMP01067545.1.p1  ORF type:complete len:305 (+),score=75.52 GEMP01067545.1:16-930(+)